MIEPEQTLALAVKRYGALPQIGMLYEEMGELMSAINQWMRGRATVEQVAEEYADVCVMMQQFSHAVATLTKGRTDADDFEEMAQTFFDQKIERLALRLALDEEALP